MNWFRAFWNTEYHYQKNGKTIFYVAPGPLLAVLVCISLLLTLG